MMAGGWRNSSAVGGPARHIPVMLSEVLQALEPKSGEIIVDGTFGAGGYTEAILQSADCKVIAIDRDSEAIAAGVALAKRFPDRLELITGRFGAMDEIAERQGLDTGGGGALGLRVSSTAR